MRRPAMKRSLNRKNWLAAALVSVTFVASQAQSPGDTIGWTQYDYQSNCATGQRIALDNSGGVHLIWHDGNPFPSIRHIIYVYIDSVGVRHSNDLGSGGFPQIAVNSQNEPGIVFHGPLTYWTPSGQHVLPESGMWPGITIDHRDYVQIIYCSSMGDYIRYTRSENNGPIWTAPQDVDTSNVPSYTITSSPISNRVAMVYIHQRTTNFPPDIFYIQSPDGQNWDWQNGKINVTNYDDSLLIVGYDLDAVYDYNGNLHIVWNAQRYYSSGDRDSIYIRHFDIASGQISVVAVLPPWPDSIGIGAGNNALCKMSIAAAPDPLFVVTYTRFNPDDFSLGGYANGEIYMQFSSNGQDWSNPFNITNSQSPNCAAGYCNSDQWSSLAERSDDCFHLFYVNDKDAGGIPQTEGVVTDNPMLYYRIPVDLLNVEEGKNPFPDGFALAQNYPNPFNAQTTIWYRLMKESNVRIEIFDLLGKKLTTLKEGVESPGSHAVVWNASEYPSGIYFCRLTTEAGSQARKIVLLK
jgi:hypothetical protein